MSSEMDVFEFISMFDKKELYRRKVYNNLTYTLNSKSPFELANLMREEGVKKLISKDSWFFDTDLNFRNPNAKKTKYRVGIHNLRTIDNGYGTVFEGQNNIINPYHLPGDDPNNPKPIIEL